MDRVPIIIKVEKWYATFFFIWLLGISIYGLYSVIDNNTIIIIFRICILLAGVIGLSLSFFGLFTLFSQRFKYIASSSSLEKEPFIVITDEQISCSYHSQDLEEKMLWKEINHIQILTTDEGPYVCDVFIVLRNSKTNEGIILPHDREETTQVIDRILQFPGFDLETFVKAMGSSENKWFNVWEKT